MSGSRLLRLLALSTGAATGLAALAAPAGADEGPRVDVIVQAASTAVGRAAVEEAGGRVTLDLPIISGVAAELPVTSVPAVQRVPGVRAVTPDATMHVQASPEPPDPGARGAAVDARVAKPKSVYRAAVGADRLAAAGGTGRGVTVAVLDTGISHSPDLAGKVLSVQTDALGATDHCVNLSGDGDCTDRYGHGTFMAGIIAGSGQASGGKYTGIAPDAKLVSIKVASEDGSADVSTVLAGIQWAVSFKEAYAIKVLNLSLGTDSTAHWQSDPLNFAVEQAWQAGIAVVVAASNRGPHARTISKPADDPWVITVGATDDRATETISDDVLPDFSGRGPTAHKISKPDLAAPGAHIVSLRASGSATDRLGTPIDSTYRSGSGTSMAAAVVSGVAAAVLSKQPTFSPDRLKYALTATARPVATRTATTVGSGLVDAYNAALRAPAGVANSGLASSTGLGSLDASRGSMRVYLDDAKDEPLSGARTAQLVAMSPTFLTGRQTWTPETWWTSSWHLVPWHETSWYGFNWEGFNWEGCKGNGVDPNTCTYGLNWEGSTWYGAWD